MLWRVPRYSGPGFPSPTTTWANASPPAYFSLSAFLGAGAFLPSASAGAASSFGLRSVRTSGSARVTAAAAASGVGATSSATHRHAHGDGAVGADLLDVDVHQLLGHGIELHVANDRHARAPVAV